MTKEYIQVELLKFISTEKIAYNREGISRIEAFLFDLIPYPEIGYDMSFSDDGTLNITAFYK